MRHALLVTCLVAVMNTGAQELKRFSGAARLTDADFAAAQANVERAQSSASKADETPSLETEASTLSPRRLGGEVSDIREAPWQVMLILGQLPDPAREGFCGGVIIAPRWILTAAECVDEETPPASVNVVAGTAHYKRGGQRVNVERIVIHPDWRPAGGGSDIALLKLAAPLAAGSSLALPQAAQSIPSGTELFVSGWGALGEGTRASRVMRTVRTQSVDIRHCVDDSPDKNVICVGDRSHGLDTCQGDIGGPAVGHVSGKPVLIGLRTGAPACQRRTTSAPYTDVSRHRSWIDAAMRKP